jgi:hypothetical protein
VEREMVWEIQRGDLTHREGVVGAYAPEELRGKAGWELLEKENRFAMFEP